MKYESFFGDSSHLRNQHRSASYPSDITSTKVAYGVLVSISIYYLIQYLDPLGLPVSEVLWNALVWVMPRRLIARFDSDFGTALVEEEKGIQKSLGPKGHASKSNAMRRILGLDGAGLLTTVQRTRTLSNLGSVFKTRPRASPPGLGNWDNSCYQNSVLQGLAALESLPEFLDQTIQLDETQTTNLALRGVIRRLNDPANRGKTFWTPAELKSMSSWQQQDAQEYFSKLSDELEKDTSKAVKRKAGSSGLEKLPMGTEDAAASRSVKEDHASAPSTQATLREVPRLGQLPEELTSLIVRNPLEGLLAQRVGCQKCGFVEGLSLVPFNCLTVPLGRARLYDVRSCLDEYTALEPIAGVECAKCTLLCAKQSLEQVLRSIREHSQNQAGAPTSASTSIQQAPLQERLGLVDQALDDEDFSDQALKKCQISPKSRSLTTKSRQAVIARAPKSLVIHVNRSNFDELTGVQSKNLAQVRFPPRLDLSPWCLGDAPQPSNEGSCVENWNTNPSQSMLSDNYYEEVDAPGCYRLRAVITHYGRHENGHYICYRKTPYSATAQDDNVDENKESWWRLSDEDVTEVDEEIVLSQGGVFMLFYEQTTSPLLPSNQPIAPQQRVAEEKTSVTDDLSSSKINTEDLHTASEATALPTPPPTPDQLPLEGEVSTPGERSEAPATSSTLDNNVEQPSSKPSNSSPSVSPTTPSKSTDFAKSAPPETPSMVQEFPQQQPACTPPKENIPISPVSMRTATPRSSRGSASRAGKAMGSTAGIVQAN